MNNDMVFADMLFRSIRGNGLLNPFQFYFRIEQPAQLCAYTCPVCRECSQQHGKIIIGGRQLFRTIADSVRIRGEQSEQDSVFQDFHGNNCIYLIYIP